MSPPPLGTKNVVPLEALFLGHKRKLEAMLCPDGSINGILIFWL